MNRSDSVSITARSAKPSRVASSDAASPAVPQRHPGDSIASHNERWRRTAPAATTPVDHAVLYITRARHYYVTAALCGAPGGHSAAAAAPVGIRLRDRGGCGATPAPGLRRAAGEACATNNLGGPAPSFLRRRALGWNSFLLHSACETQPSAPTAKGGTVPSRRPASQTHVQA